MPQKSIIQTKPYPPTKKDFSVDFRKITSNYPVHYHEAFEIELTLSGNAIAYINSVPYEQKKGMVFLLNPTDQHEIIVSEPTTLYNLSFFSSCIPNDIFMLLTQKGTAIITQLNNDDFELLVNMLKRLHADCKKMNELSLLICQKLISLIIAIIFSSAQSKTSTPIDLNTTDNEIISCIKYLHSHFKENPSLTDQAIAIGYQKNYFCRKFKLITGQTYSHYLAALKINYSKHLLLTTDLSVHEICFDCGYNSLSQFTRDFKKNQGQSPFQFRKANQNH